tara:strand:+ start:65 stop:448 length:384 start_codon:yes stop_codon:yes gene_type:complete
MTEFKLPSNRNFGIVFFVVFIVIALWPISNEEGIWIWSLVISLIFLILGLINSKILTPFNIIWMRFGLFLGRIFSPIILGFVFFTIITPTGLLMKLFKKNLLNLSFNKEKSYWIEKEKIKSSMKNQF